MNFWFTTCKPCVGELGDGTAEQELAEKGGQVVGVSSFTLDGNKGDIARCQGCTEQERRDVQEHLVQV